MEIVAFTIVAGVLYLLSDWIVNRIEIRRGKRMENRSLVFFGIILVLALVTFKLMEAIQG
jgi:predicted PurR-regulated permease PerM